MKREDLYKGITKIDDELIEEADMFISKKATRRFAKGLIAAAACLAVGVVAAAAAYTLTEGDFLNGLFGSGRGEDVEAETVVIYDEVKDKEHTVDIPGQEYAALDTEVAESLAVSQTSASVVCGDYTITAQYFLSDGMAGVFSYVVEGPDAMSLFQESVSPVVGHGASLADVPFLFYVSSRREDEEYNEEIRRLFEEGQVDEAMEYSRAMYRDSKWIIDRSLSTQDCVVVDAIGWYQNGYAEAGPATMYLTLEEKAKTMGELQQEQADYLAEHPEETMLTMPEELRAWETIHEEFVPFEVEVMNRETLCTPEGEEILTYSPISMTIHYCVGDQMLHMAAFPDDYAALGFEDGSRYVLCSKEEQLENRNWTLGNPGDTTVLEDDTCLMVFNRLVDWSKVTTIYIDDFAISMDGEITRLYEREMAWESAYEEMLAARESLEAEKEALRALPVPDYKDGVYTAAVSSTTAAGTEDVEVTVTIEGGVITAIEVNAPIAAGSLGQTAIKYMPERILEAQKTAGVDVYSGCSITSQAILDAVEQCLEEACE